MRQINDYSVVREFVFTHNAVVPRASSWARESRFLVFKSFCANVSKSFRTAELQTNVTSR